MALMYGGWEALQMKKRQQIKQTSLSVWRHMLQILPTQPNTEARYKYAQTTSQIFKWTATSDEPV